MVTPPIEELAELERMVSGALRKRDYSDLSIVGFGEISVGLGWPVDDPAWICKRMPPFTVEEFAAYRTLVEDYLVALRAAGVAVIDTEVLGVERGNDIVGYLVQPLMPATTLGGAVLAEATPDPEHPYLQALASIVGRVTDRVSVDAQVTNFSWDGETATLLDVGTPFMWNADGSLRLDMTPFAAMLPAPARSMMVKELTDVVARWKQPRSVGVDIVANLMREGLDDWVEPMIEVLAEAAPGERIRRAEAQAVFDEDLATFPKIVKLKKLQRAFRTRVQRKPYDFFVNSTYEGSSIA